MYAGLLNDCPQASTNNMLILHKNFLKLNIKGSTYTKKFALKRVNTRNMKPLQFAQMPYLPAYVLQAWQELSVKVVMNYYNI